MVLDKVLDPKVFGSSIEQWNQERQYGVPTNKQHPEQQAVASRGAAFGSCLCHVYAVPLGVNCFILELLRPYCKMCTKELATLCVWWGERERLESVQVTCRVSLAWGSTHQL